MVQFFVLQPDRYWFESVAKSCFLHVGQRVDILCFVLYLLVVGDDENKLQKLKPQALVNLPTNDFGRAADFLGITTFRGYG